MADGPDIWAQVEWARDHEWASDPADVLARRTTVAARGPLDDRVVQRAAELLGQP